MSLETVKEKNQTLSVKADRILIESRFIINQVSIPLSRLIKNQRTVDIYTGEEKIPFDKRDPLYKTILRKEFSNAIIEFSNTISDLR